MSTFLSAILAYVSDFVISRHHLALEAVALRQQLAVYKRKQPHPKLRRSDRLFWVVVRGMWNNWSEALILVKPNFVCEGSFPTRNRTWSASATRSSMRQCPAQDAGGPPRNSAPAQSHGENSLPNPPISLR